MITIPLWELIVFVLSGVALGAVIVMVSSSRRAVPASAEPESRKVVKTTPLIARRESLLQPKPKSGTLSPEERMERVTTFLKKRISSKRSVTVDEAAKCLSTSPRRVRRLLDSGALIAIPLQAGGRRVSAVSVYDLLVRTGAIGEKTAGESELRGVTEEQKLVKEIVEGESKPSPGSQEELQEKEKPTPTARQMYWYHVEGHDEPFRSIREAVQACGLDIVCTGWGEIPKNIRSKIRRERVQQQEGANGKQETRAE